jgi:hypothetical protein
MGEFVWSELRSVFKDSTNDKDFVAVNNILQKHVKLIGEAWDVAHTEDGDINFHIHYKDDNYISFTFGGTVFTGAHPSSFIWSVNVDIKNKKRLTLKDIVKIDTAFVNAAYNEVLKSTNPDILNDDGNCCSYSIEELKEDLLNTDVLYEDKHTPNHTSCFDGEDLNIFLLAVDITLPLSKIRPMVILPNFPTGSE